MMTTEPTARRRRRPQRRTGGGQVRRLIISASPPTDPGLTPFPRHRSLGSWAPRGWGPRFFAFPKTASAARISALPKDAAVSLVRRGQRAASPRRGGLSGCHGEEASQPELGGASGIWDFPSRHASSPPPYDAEQGWTRGLI